MKKILISLLLILFTAGYIQAGDGEAGIPLLLMDSFGARTMALGETFTGIADDINTLSVNPAGLNTLDSIEASSSYMTYHVDSFYGFIAGGMPLPGDAGYIALGAATFSTKDFDWFDSTGTKQDASLSAGDIGIILGYGFSPFKLFGMGDVFHLGVGIKYVQSKLAEDSQSVFCFDIGGLVKMNFVSLGDGENKDNLGIGVSVQNIGSGVTYGSEETPLPQNIRLGIGYGFYKSTSHSVLFGFDINMPSDSSQIMGAGLEYSFMQMVFLRGGYKISDIDGDGPSFGGGVKYKMLKIDYAMILVDGFDSLHNVSLGVKF
ncbi:MAG: PorV/PorQ family protein [Spirochaetes bacterium]|nr:PorV/PorQ family protein [Spirochaetota bacterium]